jgi:hypothetical protein
MNTDQLTEAVEALHGLAMAQAGKLAAQQTVIEALIAALGTELTPLIEHVSVHLRELSCFGSDELEELSLPAFESTIEAFQEKVLALQGE